MTERLYYDDASLWRFDAAVTQCRPSKTAGLWEIALDRSAFYPTSGGQPFDTGVLRADGLEAAVTDVQADKAGEVWHTADREIPAGTAATGLIDGARRTDHMEQHSGEHMLAGAIHERLGGTTIGLHLGREDSSIDVEMPDGRTHLTEDETAMLEDLVNERIRLDAPVRCWFPGSEELAGLPLRKPPTVAEHVRIVAIGDFEMVACGGTHVASTGRIGLIKILSAVPSRGKVRVTFVCGGRAAAHYRRTLRSAQKAGNVLSCPIENIARSAGELKARLADAERRLNRLETARILEEIRAAEHPDEKRGIRIAALVLPETDSKPVAEAVSAYIADRGKALLLCAGNRLTFARSADVGIDMAVLIRRVGRGGGRPDLAAGAGIPECIAVAEKILKVEA